MLSDNIVWIYIHLPKTGGTTINAHLYHHCLWDEAFIHLGDWGNNYRRVANRPPFLERSAEQRAQAVVFSGHHVFYGIHRAVPNKEARYFTIVRDPADRCVSLYNFRRSRNEITTDFETWYMDSSLPDPHRFSCHYLAERIMNRPLPPNQAQNYRLACQFLNLCWHVGLTEQLDRDLNHIFSAMSLPLDWKNHRVTGQAPGSLVGMNHPSQDEHLQHYYKLDLAMRARIYEDHPWDVRLYNYACHLNSQQWEQIDSS